MGTMMKSPRSDRDRISNLPDPVIHHILSFLEMQELANFSLTSKKLREFCISIPFLTFDGFLWEDRGLKGELINYMDRLFAVRKGMETQRVTIRWPFAAANADEKFRVVTWLYNAIACKVQLLHLEILLLNREDVFSLPLPVFHCESLKELKVDLDGGILDKFPLSGGFCNLKSLSLKNLKISNEAFGEWISSFCKNLEKLLLAYIDGVKNIIINSSTLKFLTIKAYFSSSLCNISISAEMLNDFILGWESRCFNGKSLKIFAPKLVYLKWDGYLVDFYCLENSKHIQRSAINLTLDPSLDGHDISIDQNLTRLLHSICTSRTLILAYECNKGCLPSLFCNLSCLLLDTINLNDDLVPAIACFLKGTPNLKTLHIKNKNCLFADELTKLKSNSYAFTIRYWESQNLAFVHQLEEATIELFDKGDNELELIKYLLKHARTLKRMTILYSSSFPSVFNKEVDDYRKTSTAEIVYIYI
ncbi:F-box/LRR-repeat protein At4g14103-like isoform X2 [Hevea brasiliensis]|uniref:F-box/LRR-repeat protein At4g14103-like isoform X2 n=1 Tax=Hevea brasiliensis TaxID=3981 RepID=UPI0025E88B0E|nr:F-box/LRR-repeat protein At4g14103-like isoform X2 [Hevea brasiliensis]